MVSAFQDSLRNRGGRFGAVRASLEAPTSRALCANRLQARPQAINALIIVTRRATASSCLDGAFRTGVILARRSRFRKRGMLVAFGNRSSDYPDCTDTHSALEMNLGTWNPGTLLS